MVRGRELRLGRSFLTVAGSAMFRRFGGMVCSPPMVMGSFLQHHQTASSVRGVDANPI
jgi:hypothetical protein